MVDDGSTDDTAAIVGRHPAGPARTIEHAGLSAARNAGSSAAYHELDRLPRRRRLSRQRSGLLPRLGFDSPTVAAVGGPNLPPADDPAAAPRRGTRARRSGARAGRRRPGRARPRLQHGSLEIVLEEVGGFDRIYSGRRRRRPVLEGPRPRLGDRIPPGASGVAPPPAGRRAYLRQQRGYGRAEAMSSSPASRSLHCRPGASVPRPRLCEPSSHGSCVSRAIRSAAFQSIHGGGDDLIDLAHHVGVPTAVALGSAGLICGFLVPAMRLVGRDRCAADPRARRLSPIPAASRARARSTAPGRRRGAVPPAADRTDVGTTQRAGHEER